MPEKIKLGPQPKLDDYRIFKGTPAEFFGKIEKEWEERKNKTDDIL